MSKAVLVMDMPESCRKCGFSDEDAYCTIPGFGEEVDTVEGWKHPKCPLKPLPQKQKLTFIEPGQDAITMGWNAAIEEIEG
jgi:hypothetical protein